MRPLFVALLAACGGSTTQIAIGPPPPATTAGVLVGPLCSADHCTCRDANAAGDGGAGVPADTAHKRFEIKLSSPQALWATVGTTRLYKSAERAATCFYIDLPAGETPVELRASDGNGAAGAWQIHELGTKTKSYYETFSFNCGVPGVCSFEELDQAKAASRALEHKGIYDLCGSTKIKALTWDTGKSPDANHPNELLVRLHLDVYKYAPWQAHGDPTCGKGKPPADAGSDAPGDDAPAP